MKMAKEVVFDCKTICPTIFMMEKKDVQDYCKVCRRSWVETEKERRERMKIEPKIVMELIDKLKAHKGIKGLKLKWYIVPHPEENDYLLFITKKKVKEYPEYDYIGGSLPYDGIIKDMDTEIECLFLSLEDMINYDFDKKEQSSGKGYRY